MVILTRIISVIIEFENEIFETFYNFLLNDLSVCNPLVDYFKYFKIVGWDFINVITMIIMIIIHELYAMIMLLNLISQVRGIAQKIY